MGNRFVEQALAFATDKLKSIINHHGAESVGVLASRATNEENYMAQKFARAVLNKHVDCCARVPHAIGCRS
jgi:formate dehydrogenase major subunit